MSQVVGFIRRYDILRIRRPVSLARFRETLVKDESGNCENTNPKNDYNNLQDNLHHSRTSVITPRQQVVDPGDLVIGDAGEDICEPGLRINAVEFSGLDQRVGNGG